MRQTTRMRAIVFESPGSARMADTPLPAPQIGQVRLRVVLAGIRSTDLHIFQGHFPVKTPRVLGHEIVGLVEAVGEQVAPEWLGKVYGVCPATFCGACPACRQGLFELCERFECLGNTQDGGFAEYTLVNAGQLVPIGDLKPEIAIWMEPLGAMVRLPPVGVTMRLAADRPELCRITKLNIIIHGQDPADHPVGDPGQVPGQKI